MHPTLVAKAIDKVMAQSKTIVRQQAKGHWVAFEIEYVGTTMRALYAQKMQASGRTLRKNAIAAIEKEALTLYAGRRADGLKALKLMKPGSYLGGPYEVGSRGITFRYPQSEGTLKQQVSKDSFVKWMLPMAKGASGVMTSKHVTLEERA